MRRRLPPLNALRAFEAASRFLSFTRAADELCVTPGAVSRQVKLLEDYFEVKLFDRSGTTLAMSDRSRDYGATLTHIFAQIDGATQTLLNTERDRRLHVSCAMTFTIRWLLTRLPRFHELYPERALRMTMDVPLPILLSSRDIDVAVRLDNHALESCVSHRLINNDLVPVCSPQYLAEHPIEKPDDFARVTLLHSLLRRTHWADWLSGVGATEVDPQQGIDLGSSALAYQAAAEGLGCAIGQVGLVYDDLVSGRLVTPVTTIFESDMSFDLCYDQANERSQKVIEFRDWIMEEAGQFNQKVNELTESFERVRL